MSQSPSSVWNNCLTFIKDNIQPQAYKTWFEPIIPVKLSEDVLSIQVPSKFFYEWLEEHYVKILRTALTKQLGPKAKLVYVIKMENTFGNKIPFTQSIPSSSSGNLKSQTIESPFSTFASELKNPFVIPGIRNLEIESQLNPNYTFENFLDGDSNRLARSAGIAVSNKPGGTSFNPLLVYGGVGLGKTHLLKDIGLKLRDKNKVMFISAERFMYQFVKSIKANDMVKFKENFRNTDVLLIDDIQFMNGKEAMQEEFFHTFNSLIDKGSQIIVTADRPPNKLSRIQERIKSRLQVDW
jgi:chromosomal replication initiator protein